MRWLALALVACTGNDKDGEGGGPTLGEGSGCDPLVPEVCALPWPSDLFEVEDPSTPTGLRLEYGPTTLPVNRDHVQVAPDMLNDKDGYSPLGPMVVFLDGVALDGTIRHDALDAYTAADARTVIVDTVTHARVPHFVELDMTAEDPAERVLLLRPVVPLEHGRRYVVGLRNLVKADGSAVAPSEAFRALRDGETTSDPNVEGRRDRFEALVFPELEGQGFARGELQLAWSFHTGSREASLGKVLAMRDDALSRIAEGGPAYVIDAVEEHDCATEAIARTVSGHLTAPRYTDVDAPGARLTRGPDGLPVHNGETSVPFVVRVPCSVWNDPQGGARLLQYGHGLLGDLSEARTGWLSDFANANRYVVFAQNWTGMSTWDAGWITLMLTLDVSDFPAIPERTQQGFVEWVVGLELARGALAQDPALVAPGGPVIDPALTPVYYGNSQGAILGGAYFALSPTLERGVLGVGGMPYSLLLSRSADFDPFFLVFKEKFEDHRDISLLLAMMQTVWDPGESAGYAHALRDPLPGTPPKQALLQVAVGDAQVTTLGAHVAARAYGAATVAPANRPIWGVEEKTAPFEGSAIVEWLYTDGATEPFENVPPDKGADTHECPRREPAGQAQVVDFFETGEIRQHCDGPCVGTRAGFCD